MLTPYSKKQAQTLYANVYRLMTVYAKSVNHIGFLTLTFADSVTDHKEAYKRFRSFNSNFLAKHPEISHWISVKERQIKRGAREGNAGAWHFHLLVVLNGDIKTGYDFEAVRRRDYRSASQYLRQIWKDFREACPKYGLGRPELQPVRSNAEAMGRYIGKYISKHTWQRTEEDKGVRLINYSRGWPRNSANYSCNTDNAKEWRRKVSLFAKVNGCTDLYQLNEKLGHRWPYRYVEDIMWSHELYIAFGDRTTEEYKNPVVERIKERKQKREHYIDHHEKQGRMSIRRMLAERSKIVHDGHIEVQRLIHQGLSPETIQERNSVSFSLRELLEQDLSSITNHQRRLRLEQMRPEPEENLSGYKIDIETGELFPPDHEKIPF
jgi:hypothetical protein